MPRPKPSEPLTVVCARLPESVLVLLDKLAEVTQQSRSEVVREAVERHVGRPA